MNRTEVQGYEEIDLGRLIGLLMDHKWIILSLTMLFAMGGFGYAMISTPVYQGDALVQVERRGNVNPLEDMASTILGEERDSNTAAEVQILQSRMVLGQVVDRTGLDIQVKPRDIPVIGDLIRRRGIQRPQFMQGRPEVWGGETIKLGRLEVSESLLGVPLVLRTESEDEYLLMRGGENPRFLGQGRVGELKVFAEGDVEVRVADLDAPRGAEFILIQHSRASAIRALGRRLSVTEVGVSRTASTGMLRMTLTGLDRDEIRQSLDAVAETFLTQNVQRQSAEVEQSLAFLEDQAPLLRDKLRTAEDSLNQYRAEQHSVDLTTEARATIEQFVELDSQLSALEFEEAELAQRYKPTHPTYQALLRQKRLLQEEREKLNARVDGLPEEQQEVVRRTRDVEVTQAIYVNVLNRMQELQVAKAGTIGNVRIIDNALVAGVPIQPRKPMIVLLSTVLGGVMGISIVLTRSMFKRGIETPEQLENAGLPVYATIPLSSEQKRLVRRVKHRHDHHPQDVLKGILADCSPADTAVEAMRSLRTSLHFAMLEATDNRLMITGPGPGIGKSFIAINLGAICTQAGQRVLLVDADMRKGHLHHAFEGSSEGGLSEILSGKIAISENIRHTHHLGLDYVARGLSPPNPSELLMNRRFSEFLETVSENYDLIILDTPPVISVTDAAVVGAQCGTTLMVARFQHNPIKEMQIARRRLETAGVVVKGAILNAMEKKAATYYGYGYGFYNYS
ncbi:polysaccharide biosynthesis tyrosine autokinase [Halomonas organivorans]